MIEEQRTVATIDEAIEGIIKRAEEAKANGVKPRLDKTETEYYITIPQGYKTRLYKVLIIKTNEGVTLLAYDHGKQQYEVKLPGATMDQVLVKLPLDFVEIGRKEPSPPPRPRRYDTAPARGPRRYEDTRRPTSRDTDRRPRRDRRGND
jgi:hypothetical protein